MRWQPVEADALLQNQLRSPGFPHPPPPAVLRISGSIFNANPGIDGLDDIRPPAVSFLTVTSSFPLDFRDPRRNRRPVFSCRLGAERPIP